MENIKNQAQSTETDEKLFTQDEVNAIVGKRLSEQKNSNSKELTDKEAELNSREMKIRAKEILTEKNLPLNLADVLKYDDEESLIKAIDTLENTRGFKINKELEGLTPLEPNRLPTGKDVENTRDKIRDAFNIGRK